MVTLRTVLLLLLTGLSAWSADPAWTKVRALKSGTELRIFRRGFHQPLLAKLDEATDENLIVVLKNEQQAIPKDQIDRIDCRPRGSRMTKQTRTTTDTPSATDVGPRSGVPGTSSSTSVEWGSKPDFETIYRRTAETK